MIRSFGDRATEALFWDEFVRQFQSFARPAKRKLEAINAAVRLDDLKVPPANRLEKLKGNLKDFYSIRINDQWRVIFRWVNGEAHDVRITDYHWEEVIMPANEFAPVTPGEMIKQEFLAEYGLSQNQLARALGISPNRIADIIANRRRITADTALRLSLYFGNSPEFWMNLQTHYDVKMARRKLKPQDAKRIRAQRAAWDHQKLWPQIPPLEIAGVEFIDENGAGLGVRLRKRQQKRN
jgi:addiction module HigA family antidote